MPRQRIGELLVGEGLLTEQAVSRALGFQRMGGSRAKLGTILLTWDLLGEDALLTALAKHHGCPAAMWPVLSSTPMEIVRLLPAAQAIRLGAIPYDAQQGLIRVAFVDPSNIVAVDEVTAITGRRVLPAVTSEVRLLQAHQMFYGRHLAMDVRAIVQRLDRRTTRSSPSARDFRSADLVAMERLSNPLTVVPEAPGEAIPIPISSPERQAPSSVAGGASFELDEMPVLPELAVPQPDVVLPIDFPGRHLEAAAAAEPPDAPGESLSEWVGDALAAFTGGSPARPAAGDPASPAGVEEPALYGREDTEGISDPWAYAAEAEGLGLAGGFDRDQSPITDEHRRGVPESIPPFRRAGDPVEPFTNPAPVSPLDRDADVVAGMWQPAPEEPVPLDPWWEGRAESPAAEARTRDEIAESVLGRSLSSVPRVILLGAGRTGITGWRGRGPGLTPDIVASIRVSHAEISIFSAVQESGVPHFGATDRSEWPRGFAQRFGGAPLDCALFPIRVLDGTAAFLYADRLGSPMQYEDFALIARASATAAGMLSRFLLNPQKPGYSVRA